MKTCPQKDLSTNVCSSLAHHGKIVHASSNRRGDKHVVVCLHTMEYFSAIKERTTDICCTGINLENMLGEQNLTQMNTDCDPNHMEFWNSKTNACARQTVSRNGAHAGAQGTRELLVETKMFSVWTRGVVQ